MLVDIEAEDQRDRQRDDVMMEHTIALNDEAVDIANRRQQQSRFPPVTQPPPNTQHQYAMRQARAMPSVTSQHDVTNLMSSTSMTNRTRYELPSRPTRVRRISNGSQTKRSIDGLESDRGTMDVTNEQPTIFNKEPVPYTSDQFKFSSLRKKIPVNRRDWSHYSPLLSRYRSVVVHTNRQSLKLSNYQTAAQDERFWKSGSSHPLRNSGLLEPKSDYIHYSRMLRLPVINERTIEVPHSTTDETTERYLNMLEENSKQSAAEVYPDSQEQFSTAGSDTI